MEIEDKEVISLIAFAGVGAFYVPSDAVLYVIEENAFYLNTYAPALKSNLPYSLVVNKSEGENYRLTIDSPAHIFKGVMVFNKDYFNSHQQESYVKMEVDVFKEFPNAESLRKYQLMQHIKSNNWSYAYRQLCEVINENSISFIK